VKKTVLMSFLLFSMTVCPDALAISLNEFIATATKDYTLGFQNEKIKFLRASSSNTPFLHAIEFRTRTNEFDIDKQRYTLRLRPNGWGEARDGEKVYHITLKYNEAQHELLLSKALKMRYLTIIDFLHSNAHLELERNLMVLYEDKINVLKKSVNNLDFDAKDLIDAEDEGLQIQLDLITIENKIVNIEDEIRRHISTQGPIEFDIANMADHRLIESVMGKRNPGTGRDNIHLRNAALSSELAQGRYNLEKSENRRFIHYFETNFDMEDRNELDRALSLELGFVIPIVNPNRLDMNRRKMTSIREKRRYEDRKREIAEKKTITLRDLKRLIKQYDILTRKRESGKTESSLKTYLRIDGVDPLILLKLKESMLKTDITLEKINRRIYTKYIELLDISGKLIQKPIINYLSRNLGQVGS